MAFDWSRIGTGPVFHALVNVLLLNEDRATRVFNREGKDGAIDALSGDGKTVHQAKYHSNGTSADAFADARKELAKIEKYRTPGHRWHSIWSGVTTWRLVTNVAFGTADDERWKNEVVPDFANLGLVAEYRIEPHLEVLLARHPDVRDAFFGGRPRLFVTLPEYAEVLRARDVLERALDVPLQGRDAEVETIRQFVRQKDHRVMLLHGPGGSGKSRMLYEAGCAVLDEGLVESVYCASPHVQTQDDWYLGIVPEEPALILLDEPTDPAFIDRLLFELRTRAKNWKVLVAARTPRDPIVRALTAKRERTLAPPLELKALDRQDATEVARALLAPVGLPPEQERLAIRWLVDICGRYPIWMTVAVRLLEERGEVRDMPTDEFGLAKDYLKEVYDHTDHAVATAQQTQALLRWVAMYQPLNRQGEGVPGSLATASGLATPEAVDRALEDLARRRVVALYGIDRRMVEVRPDVLRDHLLVEWLTYPAADDTRKPSGEARDLAVALAAGALRGEPLLLSERIIGSLGRMEFLIEPQIRFLDPVAEAAVRVAESAGDTIAQERAVKFADALAYLRPAVLARISSLVRTKPVDEASVTTVFGRYTTTRAHVLDELPWELYSAARGATTPDERASILAELCALVDAESSDPNRPRRSLGGKGARDVLPRLLTERRGFRTSFRPEAEALATRCLSALAAGETPTESARIVLSTMIGLEHAETYQEDEDDLRVTFGRYRFLPEGGPAKFVMAMRSQLWAFVNTPSEWTPAQRYAWELLDHLHGDLNRAHDDAPEWRGALIDNLKRAHEFASKPDAALEAVQLARKLWEWHLDYEKEADIKAAAEACEAAYAAHPLMAKYAGIFAADYRPDEERLRAEVDDLGAATAVDTLEAYFSDALRFTTTHAEQWRERQVHDLAWQIGERHGHQPVVRAFIERQFRAGQAAPLFELALSTANGWCHGLRTRGEVPALQKDLAWFASLVPDEETVVAIIRRLYVNTTQRVAVQFGDADFAFLQDHWQAATRLAVPEVFFLIGRFLSRPEARRLAARQMETTDHDDLPKAVAALWQGYDSLLLARLGPGEVSIEVVDALLELSWHLPDLKDLNGNDAYHVKKLLEHVPKKPLSWLVAGIKRRLAIFGEHNKRCEEEKEGKYVFILPNEEWSVLDILAEIADAPTREEHEAFDELLRLGEQDATIAHYADDLLGRIDPHGRLLPDLVVSRASDHASTATAERLRDWARFASSYAVGSVPWRKIAVAVCRRLGDFEPSQDDRWRTYSRMTSYGYQSWSGTPGTLHPRWQDAVDRARTALETETEEMLKPFWEWRILCAQGDLDRERQRLEEREF